jgi:hypothetical protein
LSLFYRLDAAYSQVRDEDTAFSGERSPRYSLFVIANCPVPELLPADRSWVRAMHAALSPYAASTVYVNGLEDVVDDDAVRAAYGDEKYARLAQLKAVYDPGNVFHRNANIRPAAQPPAQRAATGAAVPAASA